MKLALFVVVTTILVSIAEQKPSPLNGTGENKIIFQSQGKFIYNLFEDQPLHEVEDEDEYDSDYYEEGNDDDLTVNMNISIIFHIMQ